MSDRPIAPNLVTFSCSTCNKPYTDPAFQRDDFGGIIYHTYWAPLKVFCSSACALPEMVKERDARNRDGTPRQSP